MTPDEVVQSITLIGGDVTRPTLTRYEHWGLLSRPRRGSGGRGTGRWTDYPMITVAEAFAAWSLINGKYNIGIKTTMKISPEVVWAGKNSAVGRYKHEQRTTNRQPAFENLLDWENENGRVDYSEPLEGHQNSYIMEIYVNLISFSGRLWEYEFMRAYELYKSRF